MRAGQAPGPPMARAPFPDEAGLHMLRRWRLRVAWVALAVHAVPVWSWQPTPPKPIALDDGFHLLYELKPQDARARFAAWQAAHPQDPLGSAAEAASDLFEECYRQGVLTSEYFLDDKRFLGEIPITPDPDLRAAFFAAEAKAQDLARRRLSALPDDANALFAMTLSVGMEADYAALIDRHRLESLGMIRDADTWAKRLLAVDPNAADAYLTLGTANYVVGSLQAFKRFFLRLKGISGDRAVGITQLQIAAARGRYLRPFAKIMLALAALREHKSALARVHLAELVAEFPQNSLFVGELAKLDASRGGRDGRQHVPGEVRHAAAPISSDGTILGFLVRLNVDMPSNPLAP